MLFSNTRLIYALINVLSLATMMKTLQTVFLSAMLIASAIAIGLPSAAAQEVLTQSGNISSMIDPGVGHESHSLAIILPPSESKYSGTLFYNADEPIQLVSLRGPLAPGEEKGLMTWTPDNETFFELTFVNNNNAQGSWQFSGNALAVHTMNTDGFDIGYYVRYTMSNAPVAQVPVKASVVEEPKVSIGTQRTSGTITSMIDPGVGHESHSLAIILPPSENTYSGTLAYAASENIQLVTLHGPLAPGEDNGQPIWTPDGKTKFALTFVDPENSMGTWDFAGNALAVHTMNTDGFSVSYSVVAEN